MQCTCVLLNYYDHLNCKLLRIPYYVWNIVTPHVLYNSNLGMCSLVPYCGTLREKGRPCNVASIMTFIHTMCVAALWELFPLLEMHSSTMTSNHCDQKVKAHAPLTCSLSLCGQTLLMALWDTLAWVPQCVFYRCIWEADTSNLCFKPLSRPFF